MKVFNLLFIFLLANSCIRNDFGYAIINPNISYSEVNDSSFHFDCFHPADLSPRPVKIKIDGDSVLIENEYNDGFSGVSASFLINRQHKILEVSCASWNDMPIYMETYRIKDITLELNKDPFLDTLIIGQYSIRIKHILKSNLKEKGITDTSFYSTFRGKFKVCSESDIKDLLQRSQQFK